MAGLGFQGVWNGVNNWSGTVTLKAPLPEFVEGTIWYNLQDARRFAGKNPWKTSQDKAWFPPKASLTSMKSIPGSSEPQSLRFSPIVAGDFCKERVELHRPSYLQQKGMDGHTEDLNLGAPWRTSCQPFLAMDTSFISCITWNWHYIFIYRLYSLLNGEIMIFHAKNSPQVNTGKHFGGPSSGSDHKSWSVLNCSGAMLSATTSSDRRDRFSPTLQKKTAGLRCWGNNNPIEYPRHPSCGSAYCKRIVPGKACSSSLDRLCKHSDNSLKWTDVGIPRCEVGCPSNRRWPREAQNFVPRVGCLDGHGWPWHRWSQKPWELRLRHFALANGAHLVLTSLKARSGFF